MSLPAQHLRHQGPVLAALAETLARALWSQADKRPGASAMHASTPGPTLTATLPPRPDALVHDYVRRMGGDPAWYKGTVPPHLFPQWSFPLAARTLRALPYPMWRVVNAGCRLEMRAPLAANKPLHLSARIESIDDDGRRVLIRQRVATGTDEEPEAIVAHLFAFVPTARPERSSGTANKVRPSVPADVRELAFWSLRPEAGLEYAMLTGDVNPLHWAPAYARAFGFRGAILHGFATLARAIEGLNRARFSGDAGRLSTVDVRFKRPLVLPARVGLYTREQALWVGDAPGGGAYLEGTFGTHDAGDETDG